VADALSINCELRSLDLGSNAVGDAGARDIAEDLHGNTALHTLDLRRNGIGRDGAMELAAALEAGAYTPSLFSSTRAVSDTQQHHAHPRHPLTPP